MKRFTRLALPASLILLACADAAEPDTNQVSVAGPETKLSLIGNWQSMDDANYVLRFSAETYREFYANEEVSNDQWQAVKSCDDPQPVDDTYSDYMGFQIWTKETDSRICYAISNWTADKVSFTYAGTTSAYSRVN